MSDDVTIVVPVWDEYVPYLEPLVQHLMREWPHSALVFVDNASASPVKMPGQRVVRLGRRVSTGVARNAALPHVHTPWVCFFDADDLPEPGSGALMRTHSHGPRTVAVAGSVLAWTPSSATVVPMGPRLRSLRMQRRPLLFALASVARNQYSVAGSLLHTASVRDAGGFADDSYCEDWSLGTALAFRGRVIVLPQITLRARILPGSSIHRHGTPRGIITRLPGLHARWLRDKAIPCWIKPLFPILALQRLKQALVRAARGRRSHDDLLARLSTRTSSAGVTATRDSPARPWV